MTEKVTRYEPCVLGSDGRCTRWSHDHSGEAPATDRVTLTDEERRSVPWFVNADDMNDDALVATVERVIADRMAQAWDAALDHVWRLADPAYTITLGSGSHREVVTDRDIEQARAENRFRAAEPPASGFTVQCREDDPARHCTVSCAMYRTGHGECPPLHFRPDESPTPDGAQ